MISEKKKERKTLKFDNLADTDNKDVHKVMTIAQMDIRSIGDNYQNALTQLLLPIFVLISTFMDVSVFLSQRCRVMS